MDKLFVRPFEVTDRSLSSLLWFHAFKKKRYFSHSQMVPVTVQPFHPLCEALSATFPMAGKIRREFIANDSELNTLAQMFVHDFPYFEHCTLDYSYLRAGYFWLQTSQKDRFRMSANCKHTALILDTFKR